MSDSLTSMLRTRVIEVTGDREGGASNGLQVTAARPGYYGQICAIGNDPNVGINIRPKGTGLVTLIDAVDPTKRLALSLAGMPAATSIITFASKEVTPYEFDSGCAVGSGHDDTVACRLAMRAAALYGREFYVPNPQGAYWNITDTLHVSETPTGQTILNMRSGGMSYGQFRWTGANNAAIFKGVGWRDSKIQGLRPYIPTATGVIGFDLDTNALGAGSTGGLIFEGAQVDVGTGINNVGWRHGHVGAGGGDISNIVYIGCKVNGEAVNGAAPSGTRGWIFECGNALNFNWDGGGGAYLDKLITTQSDAGAAFVNGGNGLWVKGMVASYNNIDLQHTGGGVVQFNGRFEQGKRLIDVPYGGAQTKIQCDALEFEAYTHPSGAIIDFNRPGSLMLNSPHGVLVSPGGGAKVIHMGHGDGVGYGSDLFVRGGGFQSADPCYALFGTAGRARATIEGVGILDADGVQTGRMTDRYLYAP